MNNNQINLSVPYYCQRDNKYIWYMRDKNGIKDISTKKVLAPITCNITSLCMILHYFGITQDSPDDAMKKIFEENFKDWCYNEDFYKWLRSASILQTVLTKIYGIGNEKIEVYQTEGTTNIRKLRYSDIKNYLKQWNSQY